VVRSGGFEEGGGVGDLRPSRDHVAGDLWDPGPFLSVIV